MSKSTVSHVFEISVFQLPMFFLGAWGLYKGSLVTEYHFVCVLTKDSCSVPADLGHRRSGRSRQTMYTTYANYAR